METGINRFIKAQEKDYADALREIKNGKKTSHWIWYIFPQLQGLGRSSISNYYGIKDLAEAKEYINNDYLKNNLLEICQELLLLNNDIKDIFGYPDYLKVQSCLTLFEIVSPEESVFRKVLNKFYNGEIDSNTINLLKGE